MRTIRVTGKGQIKVRPDMTRITMTLEGREKEYAETLRRSSEDTEALKDALSGFGFERADLKTLNFGVDTEYESYQERNQWKQRFKGYKYEHVLKIEYDSDNERTGRILYALAHSGSRAEFRISFAVKDTEAAKNRLLGNAVRDAKEKAAVLAEASGVSLKEIRSIDYSWGTVTFETEPVRSLAMCKSIDAEAACYDLDINPDDIDVTDTVTVVWEIA